MYIPIYIPTQKRETMGFVQIFCSVQGALFLCRRRDWLQIQRHFSAITPCQFFIISEALVMEKWITLN